MSARIGLVVLVVVVASQAITVESLKYAPGYFDYTPLLNGSWLDAPKLSGYGVDFWDPIIGETRMWYEDWSDKILVLDQMIHGKSPEATCRETLKEGYGKGYTKPRVIFSPSAGGIGGFGEAARDNSDVSFVGVPTVDVSLGIYLLAKGVSDAGYPIPLAFEVRDDDQSNLLKDWNFGAVVISSAILTAMCIACFIVNIWKFRLHILFTRGITTAKIFFVLDLAANGMRFWYFTVNPFFVARFAYTWTTICAATHVSLSIICTLLLALKWRELLLKSKLKVTLFLTTFKWPFIVAGTGIFLLEFISSALRGHWYDVTKINQASLSILTILAFFCAVLLFVSGGQIMTQISRAVGSKRRVLQLSRTTIYILISGLGLLLWAILQMVFLIMVYKLNNATILQVQTSAVFQYIGLFCTSFMQNWAMPIPAEYLGHSTMLPSAKSDTGANRQTSSHASDPTSSAIDTGIRAASSDSSTSDDDGSDEAAVQLPSHTNGKHTSSSSGDMSDDVEADDDDDDDDQTTSEDKLIDTDDSA